MDHSKKILVLRQLLLGHRYYNALRAMNYAQAKHTGLRKDKVTPEFDHQLSMALYALTLPDVRYREELIATIFLHDVREDYGISDEEIRAIFVGGDGFSARVAGAVWRMTKKWRGIVRDTTELFADMAQDEIASLAKGCDRIHNLQSMVGVFTAEKQTAYIAEAVERIIPMLKKARRNFPEQTLAYENIKWVIDSQIALIVASLQALAS